ncbi:MAG: hypothetical protein IPH82_02140 [Chloroflexi bacterium]|nr:hypothetical protein [Chloroflexota bacterium]
MCVSYVGLLRLSWQQRAKAQPDIFICIRLFAVREWTTLEWARVVWGKGERPLPLPQLEIE